MQKVQPLNFGYYYHIYNRGINSCTIFNSEGNFGYFLKLYKKHIVPIAETYAWVLMPNHFHFLVRIKEMNIPKNPSGFENLTGLAKPSSQYFSNLFNAYSKAFNKKNNRHGSLFERPFKRKLIETEKYLKQVLIYIHNNPVHHGFTEHAVEYQWSSYLSCISKKPTNLKRNTVIEWFDDIPNFNSLHNPRMDFAKVEEWLEIL